MRREESQPTHPKTPLRLSSIFSSPKKPSASPQRGGNILEQKEEAIPGEESPPTPPPPRTPSRLSSLLSPKKHSASPQSGEPPTLEPLEQSVETIKIEFDTIKMEIANLSEEENKEKDEEISPLPSGFQWEQLRDQLVQQYANLYQDNLIAHENQKKDKDLQNKLKSFQEKVKSLAASEEFLLSHKETEEVKIEEITAEDILSYQEKELDELTLLTSRYKNLIEEEKFLVASLEEHTKKLEENSSAVPSFTSQDIQFNEEITPEAQAIIEFFTKKNATYLEKQKTCDAIVEKIKSLIQRVEIIEKSTSSAPQGSWRQKASPLLTASQPLRSDRVNSVEKSGDQESPLLTIDSLKRSLLLANKKIKEQNIQAKIAQEKLVEKKNQDLEKLKKYCLNEINQCVQARQTDILSAWKKKLTDSSEKAKSDFQACEQSFQSLNDVREGKEKQNNQFWTRVALELRNQYEEKFEKLDTSQAARILHKELNDKYKVLVLFTTITKNSLSTKRGIEVNDLITNVGLDELLENIDKRRDQLADKEREEKQNSPEQMSLPPPLSRTSTTSIVSNLSTVSDDSTDSNASNASTSPPPDYNWKLVIGLFFFLLPLVGFAIYTGYWLLPVAGFVIYAGCWLCKNWKYESGPEKENNALKIENNALKIENNALKIENEELKKKIDKAKTRSSSNSVINTAFLSDIVRSVKSTPLGISSTRLSSTRLRPSAFPRTESQNGSYPSSPLVLPPSASMAAARAADPLTEADTPPTPKRKRSSVFE